MVFRHVTKLGRNSCTSSVAAAAPRAVCKEGLSVVTSTGRAVSTDGMFVHVSQARLNPDRPWQSGREEACESSPGSGLKFLSIACTFP